MKGFFVFIFAVLLATATALAAEETWSGRISDSLCRMEHAEDADAAGGGKQGLPDPHDCTRACVRGGSKFVLVAGGKVFQITNQELEALRTHAGHDVKLTGELKGDTITVSKIEMP